MKQLQALGLLVFLLVSFHISYAHPGHPKKKPQPDTTRLNSDMNPAYPAGDRVTDTITRKQVQSIASMPAPLADYPTYHPMVVHVPIMLLILAGLLQLIALVKPSRPVHVLTLLLAAGGTVGAYVASTLVHPHTSGISQAAQLVLEAHEMYADYSLWLGGFGTLFKAITFWQPLKWLETVTAAALVCAGIAVGLAGHQGGVLTYQYGIGPRGAYLEQHGEGHANGHEHAHPKATQ